MGMCFIMKNNTRLFGSSSLSLMVDKFEKNTMVFAHYNFMYKIFII